MQLSNTVRHTSPRNRARTLSLPGCHFPRRLRRPLDGVDSPSKCPITHRAPRHPPCRRIRAGRCLFLTIVKVSWYYVCDSSGIKWLLVSIVNVFDFTALEAPFDFSARAWSELHRCPKYPLRFGEDEIDSDGVIGLIGYTITSYVSDDERIVNHNLMFLAILARANGVRSPVIDRTGLRLIESYASNGGDLTVHPSNVINEDRKQKDRERATSRTDRSPKTPRPYRDIPNGSPKVKKTSRARRRKHLLVRPNELFYISWRSRGVLRWAT